MISSADMSCSPKKTSTKVRFFQLLLLVLLLQSVATTDDLALHNDQDYDLSQERILSNEVINGNSSLLLGLQTTLNGVYDYIGLLTVQKFF